MSEASMSRMWDKGEKLLTGLVKGAWALSEYVFKLTAWGLACCALVAIARISSADAKLVWIIYGLILVWFTAFIAASLKGLMALQDLIYTNSKSAPRWLSVGLILIITVGGIIAMQAILPDVVSLFMALLTAPRLQ